MKVIVLSGYGINCENETMHAFETLGFKGKIVHVNDLINNPKQLNNYQVFALPGGFSYGDDTGSGNAMAKKIMVNLYDELLKFASKDKLIIGICNGCQILVNLGIVPGIHKKEQEIALLENDSNVYQCRWINVKVNKNKSPWLQNINTLYLPVAHQEGKFSIPLNLIDKFKSKNLIAFQYIDKKKNLANLNFPDNPNGSVLDIAGITNENGKILAMMPHPERAFYHYHQPNWQNIKNKKYADGYKIFINAKNYFN